MLRPRKRAKPALKRSHPKYPFATMKVGEMFLAEGKTLKYMSKYASQRGDELSRKFSCRGLDNGVGVWRDK
jgi:hypothetical protein